MKRQKKLKEEYLENYVSLTIDKRQREIKHRAWLRKISKSEERQDVERDLFEEKLYPKLTPVQKEEFPYEIEEYIPDDFEPNKQDRHFKPRCWYVALEDLDSPMPLHGPRAVNIILPEEVNVVNGYWGDNRFFKIIESEQEGVDYLSKVDDF